MVRRCAAIAAALILVVSVLALAGCSSTGQSLEGTQWGLSAGSAAARSPQDDQLSSPTGRSPADSGIIINSGPYKTGPGETFRAGPLSSTMMAGPDDAMQAEACYQALSVQTAAYGWSSGTLTLFDSDREGSRCRRPPRSSCEAIQDVQEARAVSVSAAFALGSQGRHVAHFSARRWTPDSLGVSAGSRTRSRAWPRRWEAGSSPAGNGADVDVVAVVGLPANGVGVLPRAVRGEHGAESAGTLGREGARCGQCRQWRGEVGA